ncbi:PREDICTED: ubiquinol-cytochrome-c reductase complex assembly factor 1-like [Lupinus angustifolius]|uniref:ubiquinol-cytochrome-c reductase complex assembly factor 1-like n=1 Tax=Lupinus angustifolius TaxID=3871 RepID=UPI00092EBF5C|nr:PREDICTED: ubiquinol-cytochrome-c reductase complex assembly factor 1-like [Lupinus angustifolius]
MFQRWSKAITHVSKIGSLSNLKFVNDVCSGTRHSYAKVAAAAAPTIEDKGLTREPVVNLDKMFWSKPCSLALARDSPLRVEEPNYEGIKRFILRLMMFYSKQSKSIRGANVVYRRIVSQVDKPPIYEVFNLEKTFKTTFSLLVLHMWLCLRRLKQEGKEGVEFGQYLYEIYNHDVELRVSKAGVNLLLTKWMKDLEKIFYGNIVAYDTAMLPEAKQGDLSNVIWKNIFSDDGTSTPDAAALHSVQAMARYARLQASCMSLTDIEAIVSGNFMFTSLKQENKSAKGSQ